MSTITNIHSQIEKLSERRSGLWQKMSEGRHPDLIEEIKNLDLELDALWHAHRAERARIRFGEREEIVRRARAEERLERAA